MRHSSTAMGKPCRSSPICLFLLVSSVNALDYNNVTTNETSSKSATDSISEMTAGLASELTVRSMSEVTTGPMSELTIGSMSELTIGSMSELTTGSLLELTTRSISALTTRSMSKLMTGSMSELTTGSMSELRTGLPIDETSATASMTGSTAGSQSEFTTLMETKTTEMPTMHLSGYPSIKNSTKFRASITINPQKINTKRAGPVSKKKAGHLLYQEFGADGAIITSFDMKNLDDVATFFKVYYETEICHVKCEDP